MAGYDYGGTRPDQITVGKDRGLSLGDTLDAALKRNLAPATPATPASIGYGMNISVAPPPVAAAPTPTLLQPKPKEPPAPPVPGSLAGAIGAANYPNDNSISNLGNVASAQGLARQTQGALLANQGYQPITDQGMGGAMRQVAPTPGFGPENPNRVPAPGQSAGTTTYQVPGVQGQAVFQGLPAQKSGTLSVMDQGNGGTVEGNVAAINRQTEALRSLREARNPGITTGDIGQVQEPKAPDMFARPGDGNGDSQKRQQEYEGLLREAANEKGWGASKRAAAKTAAAQSLIEPGMAAAKLQGDQQASANTRDAQNAQTRATLYGQMLEGQRQDRQFGLNQQNYELNQQKAGVDQQTAQAQQALHAVNALKGMSEVQRETSMNALLDQIQKTDPKSPDYERLSRIYMLAKRGTEPKADPLTSLMQSQ